ncbi:MULTISPECIES: RNA polymerase sigma factor [Microbulbifer]|uniref:RNA polymerase sigma factor n=1 Tax=Microbulbifer TaxID=48073 RepID=UPI001E335952|nr:MULTISPECIES: sigma-70 family RNA polymerase sigma factor [Microbulbifer]UHQ54305.1 sigma-70 family RNA polymerase sigma factor [Microbulbifer sp. YPW16]
MTFLRWPKRPEDRFTALVRPHLRLLHRMAYRWTQNNDEAEDLVQDILTRLFPRVDELERVDKLGPWLVRVLYRRFVDLYRRNANSPIDDSVEPSGDDALFDERLTVESEQLERLILQRELNRALSSIDSGWRDVVLLHDVEGYAVLEVAEILDLSVGTVKSRLHRARKKLRLALETGTKTVAESC